MEKHYTKNMGEITYVYGVNLEEHKKVIKKQQKRIAELEQELAEKTAKLEFANKEIERLKVSNCYIHDLHNNLYREYQKKNDELYKKQTQLDQANERLKGAIVPKFKKGDTAYAIIDTTFYTDVFKVSILDIELCYKVDRGDNDISTQHYTRLFATEQEAQEKLKELKGNE